MEHGAAESCPAPAARARSSGPQLAEVAAYYQTKTASILERYGPGPRVHYHTGIVDTAPQRDASAAQLRRMLVDSQVLMLAHAAQVWNAPATLSGDVLDVGCGLGGGSIFWAENFGARVTALTCVPDHLELVARFASEAGAAARIRPLLCDAVEAPGESCFDAAVAVDSSGYLPRGPWMRRVARLLRPRGRLFVIDCFLAQPAYEEAFNRYWCSRIGSLKEYFTAARMAGLRVESCEDVSHRTAHFWTTTVRLIDALRRTPGGEPGQSERLAASRRIHRLVREGLLGGGLRYALIAFSK